MGLFLDGLIVCQVDQTRIDDLLGSVPNSPLILSVVRCLATVVLIIACQEVFPAPRTLEVLWANVFLLIVCIVCCR